MKVNLFLGITSPTTVDRKMKAPTIHAVAAISSNKAVGASPTVARSAARAMCQRATMTIISITCTRIGESDKCNSSSANHLHHRRCAHSSDSEADEQDSPCGERQDQSDSDSDAQPPPAKRRRLPHKSSSPSHVSNKSPSHSLTRM